MKKNKSLISKILPGALIIGSISLDQWSKHQILKMFVNEFANNQIAINPFLNLVLVWNKGISFGLFNGKLSSYSVFLYLSLALTVILLLLLAKAEELLPRIAFSLMIGGAIGNIIDRIKFKAVADFIELHIANLYWPAFNAADAFICIGALILICQNIHQELQRKKNVQ